MFGILGRKKDQHFCKRCAIAVCPTCSTSKRQLSLRDINQYRVCDNCDAIMENWKIIESHEKIVGDKVDKISIITTQIADIDERISNNEQKFNDFKTKLEGIKQNNIIKCKKLEEEVDKLVITI